jgi:dolichyl-phosphate-mannose--protein O-mannosyl transferase
MNKIICFLYITIIIIGISKNISEEEIKENINEKIITCGSALRIQNEITKYYLASFNMNWSTGSHLQIITAIGDDNSNDNLFIIKEGETYPSCRSGEPILCNSVIRLEHVVTGKNLHSHVFPSMLSNSQEACGFGENGDGDVNDNFRIICYKQTNNTIIKGNTYFFLQHVPTEKYLYINYQKSMFDDYNCRGCPINGQREVSLTDKKDKQCLWRVLGGIIFNTNEGYGENKKNNTEENKKDDL